MSNTQHNHRPDHRGFTLVEVMVALVIFAVIAITLLHHLTISYSSTANQRERVFAYMKAQAILAEMHALVDSGSSAAGLDLDAYDDGAAKNPVLSIATENNLVIAPEHPLSGNTTGRSGWRWYRRITVQPFASAGNRGVRYVTVRIYKSEGLGNEQEVAALSAVINSLSSGFPTTQVYDVYMLAVENIPGWWVFMENIVPSVEAAVTDLESRNPGLSLRTHWITKASYGRNEQYRPFINAANDSHSNIPFAYYYPGKMPSGQSSSSYYVPSMMRARMNQDGLEVHGYDANLNPHPYALADFYNHAMRLPRERELHEKRVAEVRVRKAAIAAAKAANLAPPPELDDMSEEPTLRLLLEDMNTNPDAYQHALLVNLHGELAPMPAIRNYSDPAKTTIHPGLRAVTHPEELRTHRDPGGVNSDDVFLRVYAWSADRSLYFNGAEPVVQYMYVDVMDVDLRDAQTTSGVQPHFPFHPDGDIRAMFGGVTVNGSNAYPGVGMTQTTFPSASPMYANPPIAPKEMRYDLTLETLPSGRKFTRIRLVNTPVRCDVVSNKGLFANDRSRLFGLEYNPAPTGDTTFARDLAANGDGAKNTARWRIQIPAEVLQQGSRWFNPDGTVAGAPSGDVRLTIRTFIEDGSMTWPEQPGATYPVAQSPDNMSETYTWWAATRDAVPATERSQFLGDARFNPYKDLLSGNPDFGDGYNWFFASYNATVASDFPGITRRMDRWDGELRQDVPRYFELLRTGLVNSKAIYTTLTGYSYYYMGHGNEIGYDNSNGYPNSIPTNMRPFGDPLAGNAFVDNIRNYRRYVREHKVGTDYWWGMPWLGELYPDVVAGSQWQINGNLIAGATGGNQFYRARDSDCLASSRFATWGITASAARQRTKTRGCVSFMNNGTSSSHFNHHFSTGTATLIGAGLELQTNYNFPLPTTAESSRPFTVNSSGNVTPEWNLPPYSTNRFNASVVKEYYDRGSMTGSGLVLLENPSSTSGAYIVVSGLSHSTTLGSSFIAKYSLLAMLQSYFEVGAPSITHRIAQSPRVEILSPTEISELSNPTSIEVKWNTDWVRWDGKKYTATTPSSFAENEADMEYAIMHSKDNGKTWTYLILQAGILVDSTEIATPGSRPLQAAHLHADTGSGPESLQWNTPSISYPNASYLIRIESYRKNQALHYSFHTQRFFIDR